MAAGYFLSLSACSKKDAHSPDSSARLYVRIKQIDKDGAVKYSRVLKRFATKKVF
ncbi:hypothetical protein GCM10027051_18900 [Niabella terrae]